jgi:hypothetical protein
MLVLVYVPSINLFLGEFTSLIGDDGFLSVSRFQVLIDQRSNSKIGQTKHRIVHQIHHFSKYKIIVSL